MKLIFFEGTTVKMWEAIKSPSESYVSNIRLWLIGCMK